MLRSEKILQEKNAGYANSVTNLALTHRALSDVSCLSEFKNLERLDLGFNSLTSLEGLKLCVNLKWLSVAQNKLQSLNGIEGLTKLTVFNAGKNNLKSMDGLKSLASLRALILNDNEISSVCKLDQMKELNTLVLSRNPIRSLGESLIKLKSITKLSLSSCQLQTIDFSLKSCTELKELRLAHNEITSLPSDFLHLSRLRNLDLGNNLIVKWSNLKELSSLVNLKNLNLQGNPVAEKEIMVKKVKRMLPNLHTFNAKPIEKESRNVNSTEAVAVNEIGESHLEDGQSLASKKKKRHLDEEGAHFSDAWSMKKMMKLQQIENNISTDMGPLEMNPNVVKTFSQKRQKKSHLKEEESSYAKVDSTLKDIKSKKVIKGKSVSMIDSSETPFVLLFSSDWTEAPAATGGDKSDHVKVHNDRKGNRSSKGLLDACGAEITAKDRDKKVVSRTYKHLDHEKSRVKSITIFKREKHHEKFVPASLSAEEIGLGGTSTWD